MGKGVDGRRRVLATGRNDVERRKDASAHAEMLCLQVSGLGLYAIALCQNDGMHSCYLYVFFPGRMAMLLLYTRHRDMYNLPRRVPGAFP